MKKIACVLFAAFSAGIASQALALGGINAPADPAVAATVSVTNCDFVALNSPFNVTPSKNVGLTWWCSPTAVAVKAGNTKGKYVYAGTSNGGSVAQCGTTPVTAAGYDAALTAITATGC